MITSTSYTAPSWLTFLASMSQRYIRKVAFTISVVVMLSSIRCLKAASLSSMLGDGSLLCSSSDSPMASPVHLIYQQCGGQPGSPVERLSRTCFKASSKLGSSYSGGAKPYFCSCAQLDYKSPLSRYPSTPRRVCQICCRGNPRP